MIESTPLGSALWLTDALHLLLVMCVLCVCATGRHATFVLPTVLVGGRISMDGVEICMSGHGMLHACKAAHWASDIVLLLNAFKPYWS